MENSVLSTSTTDWNYITSEVCTTATQTAFSETAVALSSSSPPVPFPEQIPAQVVFPASSSISWLHVGGATVVGAVAGVAWNSWRSRGATQSTAADSSKMPTNGAVSDPIPPAKQKACGLPVQQSLSVTPAGRFKEYSSAIHHKEYADSIVSPTPPPGPPANQPAAVVSGDSRKPQPASCTGCTCPFMSGQACCPFLTGNACHGAALGLGAVAMAVIGGAYSWRRVTSHLRQALESKSVLLPLNGSGMPCHNSSIALLQRHGSVKEIVQIGQVALSESAALSFIFPQALLRTSAIWRRHTNDLEFLGKLDEVDEGPKYEEEVKDSREKLLVSRVVAQRCVAQLEEESNASLRRDAQVTSLLQDLQNEHERQLAETKQEYEKEVKMLREKLLVARVEAGRRVSQLQEESNTRVRHAEDRRDAKVNSLAKDLQNAERQLAETRQELIAAHSELQETGPKRLKSFLEDVVHADVKSDLQQKGQKQVKRFLKDVVHVPDRDAQIEVPTPH